MPEIEIRRVQVRDREADALAARLRTELALAQVDLRPRGLPPGAILLVRSVRSRVADAPAALEELLRTAARPALGPVPASAQAVLFASRAELLACLAEDASRGLVLERWWWPLVTRARRPAAVAADWTAEPEAVPAALARLAARGRAVAFAVALPDERANELSKAVAQAHGVVTGVAAVPASSRTQGTSVARVERERAIALAAPEAEDAALTVAQAAFVRLALTVARAPSLLRAPAVEPPPAAARDDAPDAAGEPAAGEGIRPVTRSAAQHVSRERAPALPRRRDTHAVEPGEPPAVTPTTPEATPAPPRTEETASPRAQPPTLPEPSQSALAAAQPARAATPARPSPPPPLEAWAPPVPTELGGLFFLLAVAQRLGLYADFTEPRRPGIAADPWRFVEQVGHALLAKPEEHADDPVWRVLDALARDDDEEVEDLDEHVAAVRRFLAEQVELEPRAVLERPALVHVNDLRVDVVFALATHPIELRLSGIDIDPGWIPAAGRALHFHFE